MAEATPLQRTHDHEEYSMTTFGFWVYLMTDCMLFATLFATYMVLHNNTFGGPSARDLFDLPYVLAETFALLFSSFTSGLAKLAMIRNSKKGVIGWFAVTFLLGFTFVALEGYEFTQMVLAGHSWKISGFLSGYFTLVGTHGLHVSCGLLWMAFMMVQVWKWGLNAVTLKRLNCLRLFWHFLDVVWIFIFTFVYLMGVK